MTKFLTLFLKILITLPVIVFLFFVTLSNRDQILNLTWSPLHNAASVSLPIVLFAALVIGFVWGSLILWSNTLIMRAERRALKKQISVLEKQLELQRVEAARQAAQKTTNAKVEYAQPPTPRIAAPEIL